MSGLDVKISVIIPVYNVEDYLSVCLSSCINQTLTDVEFICVNDGSTDDSLKILKEFAQQDYRIRIIDKPNGGVSAARNAGLRAARGEYIMFLDSDDFLAPNACERVWIEKLEAPTDIVVFGTEIFPYDHPRPTDWYYWVSNTYMHRYWEFSPKVLFDEPSTRPFLWHQAFRKAILDEHHIEFREDVKHGEDMVFLLQVYPHAKYFCFLPDKLYHYRWHREGSLMWLFAGDYDERLRKHIAFVDIICKYWQEQGWLEKYGKEYLQWLLEFLVVDIRDEQTKHAPEHLKAVANLIDSYGLTKHLSEVDGKYRIYARNVKRGSL